MPYHQSGEDPEETKKWQDDKEREEQRQAKEDKEETTKWEDEKEDDRD